MALLGSPSWLAEGWLGGDAQRPAVGTALALTSRRARSEFGIS
jgi:hypothetical protein